MTSTPAAAWHCRPVPGRRGAVAAAHPLAVRAGIAMLAAGGSAMDATGSERVRRLARRPVWSGAGYRLTAAGVGSSSRRCWATPSNWRHPGSGSTRPCPGPGTDNARGC